MDRETREERRKKRLQRHIVVCPHCDREVLDHMTQCPFCKGKLTPRGYTPIMDETTQRRVKRITTIGLSVIAGALIIYILVRNFTS